MTRLGDLTDKTLEKNSLEEEITRALMEEYKFASLEDSKEILYYNGHGRYVSGGDIIIEKECQKIFGSKLHKFNIDEIKYRITCRTYHKREEFDADINIINVKNGLYHIREDTLTEHTSDYLSFKQKPITYVKNAEAKLLDKFLNEVLYARDIQTAIDIMAYTFHRDYDIVEAIFILFGLGANGKTVYTSIITALHGPENVSNVPLSEMLKDRFALSDLENKDVNIDNELAGKTIEETAVLKRLTGGYRQPIRIQRKRQQAYDTILYAKLLFNANQIPYSKDKSDAYNRRMNILVFPNQFEGEKEDKKLLSKLTTQEELSGIFNVCMVALRRILKDGDIYVNEKTIEERRAKYERIQNPIREFLEEATIRESGLVRKEDLYVAYQHYCEKYEIPIAKKYDPFCKVLKNEFGLEDVMRRIKGDKMERRWTGITLTEDYIPKAEEEKQTRL